MKKISVYLISFFLFFNNSLYAYSSDPKSFINELVTDATRALSTKILIKIKKTFIEKMALENVDVNALGLYTN